MGLRSSSGIGIEAVRLTGRETWPLRRSGVVEVLSGSFDDDLRELRLRRFSLGFVASAS